MTWAVVVLQSALLLTLAVTPTRPPPRVEFLELLWASSQRPTFYPLIAVLIGGPALTTFAWRTKGRHRRWLILSWLVFGVLLVGLFGDRVIAMLRVLFHVYGDG